MLKQAMILAAGMGSRMQHLTTNIPKPMIIIEGISLIERHLLYLLKNNIHKVVINTYYKAEIFEEFIQSLAIYSEMNIILIRETELLGTAGGVKNALPILGKEPFFVINSDSIFIDHHASALQQLENAWNPQMMPMLMLLSCKDRAFGYWSKGDFNRNELGQLNQDSEIREFINPGMYIMDYRLFDNYPEKVLQFCPRVMTDLMQARQLYGQVYDGDWLHIGDLKAYEEYQSRVCNSA